MADEPTLESAAPSTRRTFLTRLSALGLVASCTRSAPNEHDSARPQQQPGRGVTPNPDSRLDTIHKAQHGPTTSVSGTAAPYQRYDPTVPPLPKERHQTIHWRAQELPLRLTPDLVVAAWTFEGNIPGPIVRCRVGDTIDFT